MLSASLELSGLGRQLREQHGWIELEARQQQQAEAQDTLSSSSQVYIPGSGITKRLYHHWSVMVSSSPLHRFIIIIKVKVGILL